MILAAVAAVAIGGEALRRRRAEFLERAEYFAEREAVSWRLRDQLLREASRSPGLKSGADRFAGFAAYEAAMRRKYERAARLPFLPVAPDPPDPLPE
jgi:hypothetical protein